MKRNCTKFSVLLGEDEVDMLAKARARHGDDREPPTNAELIRVALRKAYGSAA